MKTRECREFCVPVEIRADDTRQAPGILTGVLMEYGAEARDRRETFAQGSLSWPDRGVILNEQHNRQAPILMVVPEERDGRVVIESPLPDTQRGRDAAAMIRDGVFTGLSIEFRALKDSVRSGVRHVTSAVLTGVGLVDMSSYEPSTVELRHQQRHQRHGRRAPWL